MRILGILVGIIIAGLLSAVLYIGPEIFSILPPKELSRSPIVREVPDGISPSGKTSPPTKSVEKAVTEAKSVAEGALNKLTEKAVEIVREISLAPPLVRPDGGDRGDLSVEGIYVWTNVKRHLTGVPRSFLRSESLNEIARRRALDMFTKQYFEHTSPEGRGASEVAAEVGYEFVAIGENIALGNFENDEDLVTAWMNSPGHRANILSPKFVELGVAVEAGTFKGQSTWIGVQIFGKPLSLCRLPDERSKTDIERNRNQIHVYDAKLKGLNAELESLRARDPVPAEEYNQKVAEYNVLVNQINPLNIETKRLVDFYNEGVQVFNLCVTN